MQTATTLTTDVPANGQARARRVLLWTFIFCVVGTLLAMLWDGLWHITYEFDGFFSPPHVFAYTVATIVALAVMWMVFSDNLRPWFSKGFNVLILPFPVPGSLFILGGGVALLGFAGLMLDNIWHTNWGLNETAWSTPHAMIGWSLFVMLLGFLSCRMALGKLNLGWTIVMMLLIVTASLRPMLGAISANNTPAMVMAGVQIPALAAQPEFQHVARIYVEWNLTRTNPLFVFLVPLWAGAALAFIRKMDSRPLLLIGVTLLLSLTNERNSAEYLSRYIPGLLENRANYAGLPLVVMMAGFLLLRWIRLPEKWAWVMSAAVFALAVHWTYDVDKAYWWLALLGAPLALVGVYLGERAYQIVAAPHTFKTVFPLMAAVLVVPLLTGILDFYLRVNTP
jgi:hypothetical protein